jgi:RNA polymerase sigma-70 factor (ECF subfamily)
MLRARMLPPERVDDVRQETFIRVLAVLRREGGVRQPERFGAFVNSVCKNVLRENSRAYYKNRPLEEGHLDIPDKVIDLERSLINQETNSHVRGILDELSPTDRNLLRAVFLEEGDKDEICRRFGVDRDYLRVRLHRAKERFRTLFQKDLALPRRAAAKESS